MINVGENAKMEFHWKVNPYDYSKEKEKSLITKISTKYGVKKDKVKIVPEYIMLDSEGNKISVATEIISNIQNPQFQLSLFSEYLTINGIKDYDFEMIKKIDAIINGNINYDVYDKYRQYSIKWVKWKNFLSYGDDNYFDFTHLNGLVLLNGEPANQSGKTTFAIDLLHFLLFGKTSKAATQEKIFNKHLPEATEVVVEGCINIEGVDYVIKRTLKRPSLAKRSSRSKTVQKVEYYKIVGSDMEELADYVENEENENSIQTNKAIKEAIGNESDFDMIICATSSNLDELIEKKETDRGKILSRWIGLLPIEEKDALARVKFNTEIKPYLVSNRYNTEQLKTEIATFEKNVESYKTNIETYAKSNEKIESSIKEKEGQKEKFLSLKENVDETLLKVDIQTLKTTIQTLIESGKSKAAQVAEIDEIISSIGEVDFSIIDYDNLIEKRNSLSIELGKVTERYKSISNLIETVKKSEYCPTCGRRYENVDNTERLSKLEDDLKSVIEEGKKDRAEYTSIEGNLSKMKDNREKYNTKSSLETKKAALNYNIEKLRNEYKENARILNEYNKNNDAIDKNNKIDIEVRNLTSMIDGLRNERETNTKYIQKNEYDIETSKSEILVRKSLIKDIEEEEKLVRNWRIYLDMIGKNGISKMVLRKALPIINAQISYLLSDICDFTVEITINDKNDIMFYLLKDGVYSDLTSGSGFERTASALALRIVLGNISTLPRANFIILDELLGRVAKENLENIHSLLNKVADKYQYVMQISHLDEIKDWNSEVITVRKESNVSKICVSAI